MSELARDRSTDPPKVKPVDISSDVRDGSETPQWLFDLIDKLVEEITGHRFELDCAASDWNAKCGRYYDEQDDALQQDWSAYRTIWCNPPFNPELMDRFISKAIEAAESGSTVVLLLPHWPGYPYTQEVKRRGHIRDVIGHVRFLHHDGGQVVLNNGRNSSSLMVAFLGPHVAPGTNGPPISRAGTPETISEPRRPDAGPRTQGRQNATRSLGRTELVKLSELTPVATDWLWSPRIPRGELTVLDGDPSVNKSSLLMDLAARVSKGRKMPDGTAGRLGGVLLMLAEDSLRKTVLQRLTAAGADLGRIAVPPGAVVLPRDLTRVEEWATQMQAALVVIDPLIAFLGCDANSDRQVRWAMTPLKAFAERTNCAVVMVRHLTKGGGRHALYRGGGSIGIVAATRSALLLGRPSDNPDLRVLCHVKSNLGPLAPSLSFELVATPEGVVKVEWRGKCDYTPDDLLAAAKPGEGRLTEAMDFLKAILSGGPVKQSTVKAKAIEAGLAYRTIERARELLGVRSGRHGFGRGSKCHWSMPTEGP